jgi:hypothetical protein
LFKKNKIMLLLASAALITGCGGGGDGDSTVTAGGSGTGTGSVATSGNNGVGGTGSASSATAPGSAAGGSTAPPSADSGSTPAVNNPPATPPANNPADSGVTVAEPKLAGYLSIVANQLVYIKTDRSIYHAVPLHQFESTKGMFDAAAGSREANPPGYVAPPAAAPAAPIAAFGLRVNRFVQRSTDTQAVANQTIVGRVALSLSERGDSPGLLANEAPESMQLVIDKVELSVDQRGELISVRALEGAQMVIEGRSAAGVDVRETIPVPAAAVRLLPMTEVLDHYGDDSSVVLLMDLESAFSQAGRRLAALEQLSGHFAMRFTMTHAQIIRPSAAATDESPALERKELVGQAITVAGRQAVNGAGISGNAWVRLYPPE